MTNEEAVEILTGRKQYGSSEPEKKVFEFDEALNLAIKALETGEIYITGEDYNLYIEGYKDGKRDFEPKKGEWKVKALSTFPQYQPDEYECPFCKTIVNYKTNFCPNCGADMRGEKNGDDERNKND